MEPQNLLFDADDTLWESNIYFERVIEEFLDRLSHSGRPRVEMRRILNDIEHSHLATRGYGATPFGLNLIDAFEGLMETPAGTEIRRWIAERIESIQNHDIELLDGVAETLEYLSKGHRLVLLTKGREEEQLRKFRRSGVSGLFGAVEVVSEKEVRTYLTILEKYRFEMSKTWMIGNSPKSDINPALAGGLHAILIPHDQTWVLEHEDLPGDTDRFRILERFRQLQKLF
jgi:putative hydrolase of the HAD superfamily